MAEEPNINRNKAPDEFVRLFMAHQRRILAFVLSLEPNLSDAEDIVQEVSRVLWEKFDQFERGTNFAAWAFSIVRLEVLEFRRAQSRKPLVLSESLIEQLADDTTARDRQAVARQKALDGCLEGLESRQRDLLAARYARSKKLAELASEFGRSVVTIRKMLRQAYAALAACIDRKLAEEEC